MELPGLGGFQIRPVFQQGGDRAPDCRQGSAELLADQAQELGPQPAQLLQLRQVLQGHHVGLHVAVVCLAVPGADGGGVDQGGDAAAVGDDESHLLGPHRLAGAHHSGQGQFHHGRLLPVGPPDGQTIQQLLRRLVRTAQSVHDAQGLPVEGGRGSRPHVEDHHAHGGGVDQGLQAGSGPPLIAVAPGVGDGHGRLGGEHHQRLLVLDTELTTRLPVSQVDDAHALSLVADRRHQQGVKRHRRQQLGQVQRSQVACYVRHPQGLRDSAEILEEPPSLGQVPKSPVLRHRQAGDDEVGRLPGSAGDGERPVAGASQGACCVHRFLEHGVEVQALVDAEAGRAQTGQPLPQGRRLAGGVDLGHGGTAWVGASPGRFVRLRCE